MRSKAFSIVGVLALAAAVLANPNFPQPYNGATQPNNLYSNPNFMNKFVKILTTDKPACKDIPSIGHPVLAVKQYLIIVDKILDAKSRDSFAKIIFFKETKAAVVNPKVKPNVTVKLVALIKVNNENFFVGVRARFINNRKTPVVIEAYIVDTILANVGLVIGEQTLDENAFVGCGNVKEIYTNFIKFEAKKNQKRKNQQYNVPYGNAQLPLLPQQFPAFNFFAGQGFAQ